jgi:glyoxylase-like metal-dependent hydrolase (beta-lactamase superfamily II)
MHCYLADGYWEQWLANLERLRRELPPDAGLHIGHGNPAGPAVLEWQRSYVEGFLDAARGADWSDVDRAKAQVAASMDSRVDQPALRFLMELSIEPVATKLGLIEPAEGTS